MSDTNGVQVNISASTSDFEEPVDRARVSASDFAAALKAAGNDLRKITSDMLGTSGAYDGLATAILNASTAANQATVIFKDFSTAGIGVDGAFRSAADSADFFLSKLNPTPLQMLRKLMAEDIPAAAVNTAVNFKAVIEQSTGLTRSFLSAADSAAFFNKQLDPSPLQKLRSLMAEVPSSANAMAGAMRQTSVDFLSVINASTGVSRGIRSAADSADFFTREINRIPLAKLREQLVAIAPAAEVTYRTLQQNIDAANGVGRAFNSAAESARFFSQQLDPSPLQKMRSLMADDIPPAAHASSSGMSGLVREFIVLGHEGLTGNWTRIPGTILVMTEYMGGLRSALVNVVSSFTIMQGAGVGALLAVAGAFAYMIVKAHEATLAINEATNAATMQGRSPAEARVQMKAYADQLRSTGIMGETAMTQVASSLSQLGELTEAQKNRLAGIGTPLFLAWNNDVKKMGENLSGIFASTGALDTFLQKEHLLSTEQQTAWSQATTAAQKYDIGIAALTARYGPLNDQIRKQGEEARRNQALMFAGAETPGAPMDLQGAIETPKHLGDFEPGTKQVDPSIVADNQAVIDGNKHLEEKMQLEARLAAQHRDLARAVEDGDLAEQALARSAISGTESQIQLWRAAGDSTWEAKQQGALNTILLNLAATATNAKQLAMDENTAREAFWNDQAKTAGLTEGQITTARANATRARLALTNEELRGGEAGMASWMQKQQSALSDQLVKLTATATSSKQLAEDENRTRMRFWDEAAKQAGLTEKEITAAHAEANRARLALAGEELRGGESAAKQALAAKLATLSEEQAANHDNFAKVMEIEGQKIALLRAAGAAETKQLQDELAKQENLRREHAVKVLALAEQTLAAQRTEDTAAIGQLRQQLNEEVSERTISKNQEMQALRAFANEKHALELQSLESLLSTIDPQLAAYTTLYNKIRVLKQQWLTEDKKMNAEATADLQQQWDKATAPISSAIDGQVGAMLKGTQTIGQSVSNVLGGIVTGYAEMGVKAAQHWASSQLMQLFVHQSTEASKTASSALGASARMTIASGETASENAGLLVRIGRWIATQFGMTGATATGAATREGVLTAEQIAATQATGIAARLSIAAAAAVAAAWAFADSAQAGPPGLAAAPGVAAGAEAAVMAYQLAVPSLAVGAWNVPRDMGANLHTGEMVVPANFASGMRANAGGGGGDTNLHYSPTVNGGNGDLAGMMREQAGAFKSYLWHATRNGALKLPGR